jgi:CheY-like chemotaxis protein
MRRPVSGARKRAGPILLVDDYDDARATVREALEEAGYVAIEAADGQQALNYLVAGDLKISLIIVDLQMPVMDGWRLIELLNSYVRLSTIPVIVATAASQPHLERIKHAAVRGCLQAPYDLRTLVDLVDSCLYSVAEQSSADTA